MYDIIIIGAGPAGMTAAIYAKRAKKNILLLEALIHGGQAININKIDNYPGEKSISGYDFVTNMYEQIKSFGVEVNYEKAIEIKDHKDYKEVITNDNTYQGKTVILATGASKRKLGLEKEDYYLGKGLSYCAICDGAFFNNKIVAVVGSESNAIEDALYLSDIAKKVIIINSKEYNQEILEKIKSKDNIEVIQKSKVTKLIGDSTNKSLSAIEINNEKTLEIDGLFVEIGQVPANEVFNNIIKMDKYGYIIAEESCHTNVDGIFVAGDNRTKSLRQLVTATSDGAIAATEAIKYIEKNGK